MAQQKQHWKDSLRTAKQKGDRQDDRTDPRWQKKQSTLMYKRRKLDKDVKRYTNNANPINSRALDRIGTSHGFHIVGTPFREDSASHEDA